MIFSENVLLLGNFSYSRKRNYMKPIFFRKKKKVASLPSTKNAEEKPDGVDRLERFLAHLGLASRREAKDFITRGMVTVNGKVVREPGFSVNPEKDKIKVQGKATEGKESLLLYKPRGIETSATTPDAMDIHKKFPRLAHLSPIGRLDKDSEGLIIMSNDGTLARALTKEESNVEKEYLVTTREYVPQAALEKMRTGIFLDRVKTKPANIVGKTRRSFLITLKEGRKHQIRRMCNACKLTIETLVRVRIGHITVGKMESGNVKKLTEKDVELLKGL